jgi:hypothetical protein
MANANAAAINQGYQGVGERINRFLAARGMGKSGATGTAALQTELGRQGSLAQNLGAASGQQLGFDENLLSDALQFAFATPGQKTIGTDTTSGSQFGMGAGMSGGIGKGLGT